MGIRPDEEFAACALERWLTAAGRSCSWKPGSDPPDLAFVIDGERWAFEVTGLHQYFVSRRGPTSRAGVNEPLFKIIERLDREVVRRHGHHYIVFVTGPVRDLSFGEIEEGIRTYINSGATDKRNLDTRGDVVIWTERVSDEKPTRVGLAVGLRPTDMGAHGTMLAEVHANLKWTMERMLKDKRPILKRICGFDRKGLLLYAVYFFADAEHVRRVLTEAGPTMNDLDSIVLVDREKKVSAVHDPSGLFPADSML